MRAGGGGGLAKSLREIDGGSGREFTSEANVIFEAYEADLGDFRLPRVD